MQEIHKYKCESCHQEFDTIAEAQEHEKECAVIDKPVKAICLDDDGGVGIMLYPKARYWRIPNRTNRVNLMPQKYNEECNYFYPENIFLFDQIKRSEERLIIYTMNLTDDYEKECIKRLMDERIKDSNKIIEYLQRSIEKMEDTKKHLNTFKVTPCENMLVELIS